MTTATRTRSKAADAPAAPPPEPKAPEPVMLTAALASKAMQRRNETHTFSLPATARAADVPAIEVTVKVPDLGDPEILTALPDQLLRTILMAVNDVEAREGNQHAIDISKPEEVDFSQAKRQAFRNTALINAYCLAGFVEPQLVLTEAEQKNTSQVLLEAIHPTDRAAFFNWCQQPHMEAAAAVEPFPDGPDEGVAAGGPGGVSEPAERSLEVAGDGGD
jgi:hypothetical protein